MVNEKARKLGEGLVAAKVITSQQLKTAIDAASKDQAPSLIVGLLEEGFLTFKVFEKFIASTMGIQSAIVASRSPIKQAVELLGREILTAHLVYPFGLRVDKGIRTLALGMVDPLNSDVIRIVETKTGCRVVPVLISLPDFRDAMSKFFQPQVEIRSPREEFVLVRPGGDEENVPPPQTATSVPSVSGVTSTSTFRGTKTVQPKPGWDQGGVQAHGQMFGQLHGQTQVGEARLSVDLMGANKKKFREEILAILDLDPVDAKFLKEDSYTREILFSQLKNASPNKLQKIYNGLSAEIKLEGLVNTLIKAGVIAKNDLLIWSAVSQAFFEEKK